MPGRRLASTALLALVLAAVAPDAARAQLMTACASEIERYCNDVTTGRGRMAACLIARLDALGASCRPEVEAAATSWLAPPAVRSMLGSSFSAQLPEVCAPEAARLCSDVSPGGGRIFACLYARADRVTAECQSAARTAIDQAD